MEDMEKARLKAKSMEKEDTKWIFHHLPTQWWHITDLVEREYESFIVETPEPVEDVINYLVVALVEALQKSVRNKEEHVLT